MKGVNLKSGSMLLLAALIWGLAFVAQSEGMKYVGPFTFNGVRSLIGGLVLIPFIMLRDKRAGKKLSLFGTDNREERKLLIKAGLLCGLMLTLGSSFQQVGIQYTTVGKAGFITAMYIVIVPLFGIFMKKKPSFLLWISVVIAVAGMYFLCKPEAGESINKGDVLMLICAFAFSGHIMVVDKYSEKVDPVRLSCVQFFVCGVLCSVMMLIFEKPAASEMMSAWLPILYAGVLSCGVAYTLQIVGQRGMNPVVASLLLSLESVFAALAGIVVLKQTLSSAEIIGCALMFAAIILAQVPVKKR